MYAQPLLHLTYRPLLALHVFSLSHVCQKKAEQNLMLRSQSLSDKHVGILSLLLPVHLYPFYWFLTSLISAPWSVFDRQWLLRLSHCSCQEIIIKQLQRSIFIEKETFQVVSFTFYIIVSWQVTILKCLLVFFTPLFAFLLLLPAVIAPFFSSSFSPLISPECFLTPPSTASVSPPFPLFFIIHPSISFATLYTSPPFSPVSSLLLLLAVKFRFCSSVPVHHNSSPLFPNTVISFTSPLLPSFCPSSGHE